MAGGTVLTTQRAADAARIMGTILNSGFASDVPKLNAQGTILSELSVWQGAHADTFRGQWPSINATLNKLVAQLQQLQTAVTNVNQDILHAGGG
jgi:uncharacterized protein YukE